jgi:tetratricopeptide (TPR) repeat protein
MKEVEKKIKTGNIDDYNKVLKVYPIIPEATRSSIKGDLDYIIEKAALPVNKHQNSEWVDDSYNLIGKSRLYQKEYKLAVQTFKYVNTKAEDKNAKHAAMILLLRTFLDTLQPDNAAAVHEFIIKEKIQDINAKEFFLAEAAYFQHLEDYEKVKTNLEAALPHVKLKEDRARIHFIIAQIYQLQAKNEEAYKHYNQVFKNNPPYELFFFGRLYLAQVSNLADVSDRKKIDKYFKKLLKDQKNLEYRDKIYYEMGKYELKQNNYNQAIKNFQQSIAENKNNPFQKARTYLALAQVYYDNLHKYTLSKLYYDSTVTTWDPQDKEYKGLVERQKILTEFSKYIEIVEREDSLQKLAKMDTQELDRFVTKYLDDKAKKERELALRKEKEAEKKRNAEENALLENPQFAQPQMPGMGVPQEWVMYVPSMVAQGKADFTKKWGKRKLEDNWRRSQRQNEIAAVEQEAQKQEEEKPDLNKIKEDSLLAIQAEKEKLIKDIPRSGAELDSSNARIEVALYNVGKIYNFKLNEKANSIETFKKHLSRFPDSEYKPEIYYLLYLIYKNQNSNDQVVYKDKLKSEFPASLYSRLIENPNYLAESKIMNQEAASLYKTAFELYKSGDFITSDSMISSINSRYPENDIKDKLALLSIMNKGQTLSSVVYKKHLKNFIAEYSESPLKEKAEELLETADKYIAGRSEKGIAVEGEVKFMKNFEKPHMFVCLMKDSKSIDKIKEELSRYNKVKGFTLPAPEIKSFSDSTIAVFFSGFRDKQAARTYLDNCEKESGIRKFTSAGISPFIISSDNFRILEGSGNTNAYLKFFKLNYHETLLYGE